MIYFIGTILIVGIPIAICLGGIGMFFYWWRHDDELKKKSGQYYNHPDKDMPLYDKGPCDRYSAGTFHW